MKNSVNVTLLDKMAFEADVNGHKLVIDAAPAVGGEEKGPRPKPLMLVALAGCTGMDVISILRKMRVEVQDFKVTVEADMTEEHPMHYTSMHVIYEFTGKDLPQEKLERAVQLSQDNYCGVNAVYKKALQVTHEIRVHAS